MKDKKIVKPTTTYKPVLNFTQTEEGILRIKQFFQKALAKELDLLRVTAPLFVKTGTGINDDLNGIEKPVSFTIKSDNGSSAEIVQSLAKWKRMTLGKYGFTPQTGLYTDMNAIRPDEELDAIHSLYVDQWDWEKVITKKDRTIRYLKDTVNKIYKAMVKTEKQVEKLYPSIKSILPKKIYFIHSQELENLYPDLTPKQREYEICKKHKAVFIIGIGAALESGEAHDGRAADYDDWSTPTTKGHKGLNGDILVWHPTIQNSFELSSMGIRVDQAALERQLKIRGQEFKKSLLFHKMLLEGKLPLSIGGGIGQSRLCMFFLRKIHVGEVQSSIWPEHIVTYCEKNKIPLL